MILNTGARTDTVNYYGEWLFNRFAEGYVLSRNPVFPHKLTRYELSPEKIDAVLFCSKNYAPVLPRIREITDRFRTYFHYTITAYGRDVEPNVPDVDASMETLKKLAAVVGRQRVAWRYDPVLLTKNYTVDLHIATFERMARELAPHVDRCVFSFVETYKKLRANMPELVALTAADKEKIAVNFGAIAARYGLRIQTCGTFADLTACGIERSGCATLDIIGKANGCEFRQLKHNGLRAGCGCIESHDVGAYDSCPNGCKYCYANNDASRIAANCAAHDPTSPLLIGRVGADDEIIQGVQKSFLQSSFVSRSFFD